MLLIIEWCDLVVGIKVWLYTKKTRPFCFYQIRYGVNDLVGNDQNHEVSDNNAEVKQWDYH